MITLIIYLIKFTDQIFYNNFQLQDPGIQAP